MFSPCIISLRIYLISWLDWYRKDFSEIKLHSDCTESKHVNIYESDLLYLPTGFMALFILFSRYDKTIISFLIKSSSEMFYFGKLNVKY